MGYLTQQKWISKLLGYDFIIEYKFGKENLVADTLFKKPKDFDKGELWAIISLMMRQVEDLKESYANDKEV